MDSWKTSAFRTNFFSLKLMMNASAAGAGKTVIWYDILSIFCVHRLILFSSSATIDDICTLQRSGLASLAFFYCDFRDEQKKHRRGLLSSLLAQLGGQSGAYSDILSGFIKDHQYKFRPSKHRYASDSELADCLKDMLKLPGQATVHIIIDALDECPMATGSQSSREKVLEIVEDLVKLQIPNLRICVTSRLEADILPVLEPLALHSVSLHSEDGQLNDISEYVKFVVHNDHEMRRWKATDKQLVIDISKKLKIR